MEKYNHKKIEAKWQKKWEEDGLYRVDLDRARKPFYNLMMFPYPSAEGLHVGNMYAFVHSDTYGRFMRLKGFDVFEPIGLDGFGIHSENYAIKIKEHIKDVSARTEKHFYKQLHMIGNAYDWSRTVETYKPNYYKWTQWLFLKMYEKGLAYRQKSSVNWCPSCKTVLSDEQVIGGKCERCSTTTEKRQMEQWFWRITDYAEKLLKNLDVIDWSEEVKTIQRNWIGKSEGASVKFQITNHKFPACAEASAGRQTNSKLPARGWSAAGGQAPNYKQIPKYDKILLASSNLSKKKRVEKLLKGAGIKTKILIPKDLNIKNIDITEDGDLFDNAKDKALVYRDKTNLPILGVDTGFFIKDEEIDPVKVKRNALGGKDESEFSQEEIADKMFNYYKDIARRSGGKVDAYWQDVLVLSLPDGTVKKCESKREIILTDQACGQIDKFFPVRSLYKSRVTGKYTAEETKEEELQELQPITNCLIELLGGPVSDILEVFTTRPDTLFGATYFVLSPEHELLGNLKLEIRNWEEVERYIKKSQKKSEMDRADATREKTGVKLEGVVVINPVNNKEIPIFVADYVLMGYGTGAIMAVPAHDERDWEFAKKYGLKIIPVAMNKDQEIFLSPSVKKEKAYDITIAILAESVKDGPFLNDGIAINSDFLDGLETNEAKKKMIEWLEKKNLGKRAVNYKLRDWCISRQRYWGPPIPMIECEKCEWQPVLEKDLPVLLPEMDDFLPDGSGKGPLNKIKKFVDTTCPKCKGPAKRETDVSDPFVDSCWYYMRYPCTEFDDKALDKKRLKKWMPVDMYIGGKEHSVLHLLYSRFVTMVLHELGYVPEEEPYKQFRAHGLLIKNGAKISKSRGNIVNPDEYIEKFGADAVRMYLMFLGDMRQGGDWRDSGINGMYKFVNRIYNLKIQDTRHNNQTNSKSQAPNPPPALKLRRAGKQISNSKFQIPNSEVTRLLHKTIKGVGEDLDNLKYNTAISKLMVLVNKMQEVGCNAEEFGKFLVLLAPFAPHLAEELWQGLQKGSTASSVAGAIESDYGALDGQRSIFKQKWPEHDKELVKDDIINLVVQVNGKLRDTIEVSADIEEDEARKIALGSEKIKKWIEGKNVVKVIFVKGRLVNIVIKNK